MEAALAATSTFGILLDPTDRDADQRHDAGKGAATTISCVGGAPHLSGRVHSICKKLASLETAGRRSYRPG